jgi:hypothetical protein
MATTARAAVAKRMAEARVSTSAGTMGLCAPVYERDRTGKEVEDDWGDDERSGALLYAWSAQWRIYACSIRTREGEGAILLIEQANRTVT